MLQQFYRTSILLGEERINSLANRHIIIAGVGGVGGLVVEAMARVGVGKITIIDNDVVDITNINRQIIATLPNVGKSKVELFASRVAKINPECKLIKHQSFIDENSISQLIGVGADYVIDCIDTVVSKLELLTYCKKHDINVCSSMGAGNRYDVTKVKLADISKTKQCALARNIRLGLCNRGIKKGIMTVYSEEAGSKPLLQGNGLRPINGTISYLPGLFGLMIAGYVIKELIATS